MENKEKFLKLVSHDENNTLDKIKERNANRLWLRASQEIAKKVLIRLRELGWSKTKLAQELGVSKQQVSKIVRGSENFTISTIVKLELVLNLKLLAHHRVQLLKETSTYKDITELVNNNVAESTIGYKAKETQRFYMSFDSSCGEYSYSKGA